MSSGGPNASTENLAAVRTRMTINSTRSTVSGARASSQRLGQATKDDKKQIKTLERDLARKEKALAEAAALLVLRKNAAAIWGDGEDA